jgi:acyl-CoA-binding protein
MSDLKTQFEQAAREAQKLPKKPDNDTLLRLYALYKQATVGDVSGKRPGFMDMVGQAKYDAWAKVKGSSKDAAMQAYIDLVDQLKG